jgi:phosphate transport system substrate-binding protein
MKTWKRPFHIGLLATALLGAGHGVSAEALRIGGSGAIINVLPVLFAAFDRGEDITLEAVPSLGSNGGLRALGDGVLDIAVAGRSLKPEERAQGLTQVAAIRTPFVLVTSHPRPNGLKSADVAEVFKAAKATWADGSLIRIILRPKSDSDTAILGGMFPGMSAAIEEARARRDIPLAATDQDNADQAEQIPASLAAAAFTQVQVERRNLRFVAIDDAMPSLENLQSGTYPFAKTIYFVLPAKKAAAAERFIAFLRSPDGQAALRATGNLLTDD